MKSLEELEYYKLSCSRRWNVLELQEFCVSNRSGLLGEFQPILQDVEKQKTLNKNLLRRKLDKILKGFAHARPRDIFSKEVDPDAMTLTLSPSDLFLETLRMFDLPSNYMDGGGHWYYWQKRKQEERNEENRQKGMLSKKKNKAKKKRTDDPRDAFA